MSEEIKKIAEVENMISFYVEQILRDMKAIGVNPTALPGFLLSHGFRHAYKVMSDLSCTDPIAGKNYGEAFLSANNELLEDAVKMINALGELIKKHDIQISDTKNEMHIIKGTVEDLKKYNEET